MKLLFLVNRLTKANSCRTLSPMFDFWHRLVVIFSLFFLVGGILSCSQSQKPPSQTMMVSSYFWEKRFSLTPGKFLSLETTVDGWVLRFTRRSLVVRAMEKGGWKLEWLASHSEKPRPSYAVVSSSFLPSRSYVLLKDNVSQKMDISLPEVFISHAREAVLFTRGDEILFIHKRNGLLHWMKGKTVLLSQRESVRFAEEGFQISFDLFSSKAVLGLAEKASSLNLRGQSLTFYNKDTYKYQRGTDPLYLSIPFALIWEPSLTVGIFLDNPAQSFWDIGSRESSTFGIGATEGECVLYLWHGSHLESVIAAYTDLTGKPSLPPRWALGYQQSRFSYFPQKRVLEVAKNFREKNLPCDVIYLDIDFMDGRKSFMYDTNRFPSPRQMLAELHQMDFRAVTIINPGVALRKGYPPYESGVKHDVFVKYTNGKYVQGTVWPGICLFPDYTKPLTRRWWGDLYTNLIELGFDGFWNDMNEPSVFNGRDGTLDRSAIHDDFGRFSPHSRIHNAYGLTMVQATWEGLVRLRPNKRPFVLSRAGYAGIQRYAFVWTGDNTANWDHLALNLSMVLNLGLCGVAFSGADIGGYSATPSEELFIRWMQLGVFLPFVRNHTEQGTAPQEPWAFGLRAEEISRRYLFARYRLLPFWYTLAYEASLSGVPLVRPLHWRGDLFSEEAFYVGDQLLVLPVLKSAQTTLTATLPPGTFYDWRTKQGVVTRYEGAVSLEDIPVLVKAGSILPLANLPRKKLSNGASLASVLQTPDEQLRSTKSIRTLSLWITPGENGEGKLFWDDGETPLQEGMYTLMIYRWQENTNSAILTGLIQGKEKASYLVPFQDVVIQPSPVVESVLLDGKPVKFLFTNETLVIPVETFSMWKNFTFHIAYKRR